MRNDVVHFIWICVGVVLRGTNVEFCRIRSIFPPPKKTLSSSFTLAFADEEKQPSVTDSRFFYANCCNKNNSFLDCLLRNRNKLLCTSLDGLKQLFVLFPENFIILLCENRAFLTDVGRTISVLNDENRNFWLRNQPPTLILPSQNLHCCQQPWSAYPASGITPTVIRRRNLLVFWNTTFL